MKIKGFTLIELLLVTIIIGILVGIAVMNIVGIQERSKIAKAKSELRTLQTAVENYYIHHNAYPASLDDLLSATPQVLRVLPKDPFAGSDAVYCYERSGTNNKYYVIYSIGVNGLGSAEIKSGNTVEESDPSCIYVSNAGDDTAP